MIGIVVVSHSRPLADDVVALAQQMVPADAPRIAVAAGMDDGSFGTDAAAIALAIASVDSPDGVLVLLDLGSALLSTELAIEFLDGDLAKRVMISPAPLVEGLLSAVVSASTGASLVEVDQEAREALQAKSAHLTDGKHGPDLLQVARPPAKQPAPNHRVVWRATVRNPHGIHVRPAAMIVTSLRGLDADVTFSNASTGRGTARGDSLSSIAGLEVACGQILEARISGPDADAARDVLAGLATQNYGEDLKPRAARTSEAGSGHPGRAAAVRAFGDVPAAAERRAVMAPVTQVGLRPPVGDYRPLTPKDELARFNGAVAEVDEFLDSIIAGGEAVPGILEAQRMMLADRELQHGVVGRITAGFSAVDAVDDQLTGMARSFDKFTDAYLRERGQDLRSLRRMLLLALLGRRLEQETPDEPRIWVLEELDAATAMRLDPRLCMGVVTIAGGSSGHGMLAAQARGIPVLTGCRQAAEVTDGQLVAFDPVAREFWPHPDQALRVELARRNAERTAAAERAQLRAHEPAVTTSGQTIKVEANIGSVDDAQAAAHQGADGSGVVRTENIFAKDLTAPSVEAQTEVFVRIGQTIGGPITIRTWDPSGDKPLAFMPNQPEDNPALGERGIRMMRKVPQIFRDQIKAALLAAQQVDLQLMIPMVTDPEEMAWAKQQVETVRAELGVDPVPVGMMIEVPAAALRVAEFAALVDFVSVGTNDLSQYTQAADRTNDAVRQLARQDSPAVLELIRLIRAALPGIPMAVCGDLASDLDATRTLIELGADELSVRPGMVAEIKEVVRAI